MINPSSLVSLILSSLLSGTLCAADTVTAQLPIGERNYPNLIYNPGFEYRAWYTPDEFQDWSARPNIARSTGEKHSGEVAMKIGPGNSYIYENAALLEGETYELSFRVKTENVNNVSVAAYEISPGGGKLGETEKIEGTNDWARYTTTLTPVKAEGAAQIRINFDIPEGGVAYVDDVELVPLSGKVARAEKPTITPGGGTFKGDLHVTLGNTTPGAAVYYTTDGTEPNRYSTRYRAPFILTGPCTLKAKALSYAHQESEISEARFVVEPRVGDGVPSNGVGWDEDVETWWSQHLYNPQSPNAFKGPIVSPEPRINVADVRKQHPDSTTAGIQEALDLLPPEGGTLYFPKEGSPYVVTEPEKKATNYYYYTGAILIQKRSNLHFISDGAVIESAQPLFGVSSMGYVEGKDFQHSSRNFYFKGLTFDGLGEAESFMMFRNCGDLLFDDCVWKNLRVPEKGHPGAVNATSMSDNVWFRNCRFLDGANGAYLDGVHNAGFLNCHFGAGVQHNKVLLLTNNDMVNDSSTLRTCQYVVFADCEFQGPGHCGIAMTAANVLIKDSKFPGNWRTAITVTGRGRSNIQAHTVYDAAGVRIIGNEVEKADTFVEFINDIAQHSRLGQLDMKTIIGNNTLGDVKCLLRWDSFKDPHTDDVYSSFRNVLVTGNRFNSPQPPAIRLDAKALDRVSDIVVKDNSAPVESVLDLKGQPLSQSPLTLE